MHQQAINAILKQQSELSRTQNQVASGRRVQTAADDPVAVVQLQALTRMQAQQEQYGKNAIAATDRLQLEEQALADSTTVLQRVRELTLQANTATVTDADRRSIATEIRARIGELQGIANRRDNNGDYVFAGFSASTQPFVSDASGAVVYAGDAGQREVQIDAAVSVPDGDSGAGVYAAVTAGNGLFTTSADTANTGSGSMDIGAIVNRASWVPDSYTVTFTSATTWQVTNSASTVVAAGTYTDGAAISFNGVQVSVSGTPQSGDKFQIDAASTTDVFSGLQALADALEQAGNGDAARAQLTTTLGGTLQQLDQSLGSFSDTRARIGARLSLLQDLDDTRQSRLTDIATSVSQLRDLDYASAISKMNQQMVGLQAAQQAYIKIAGLSLFNYL
jgi:flagellar hook-associated protein 3 FlgL